MLHHQHAEPIHPDRVVVLGANGFVGQALCKKLFDENIPHLGLSYPEIDLTQEESVQELLEVLEPTDTVILFAATAANRRLEAKGFIDNINITKNACVALAQICPKHFIYFSSDAVYSQEEEIITESSPAAPKTLYGVMHLAREILCQNMAIEHNIPFVIVRSTQIYGDNASHNAYGPMRMCRSALSEGKINLFGQGEEERDYIVIEDVVTLLSLMMRYKTIGLVNFATGISIAYTELAGMINQILGYVLTIVFEMRKQKIFHRRFMIDNLYAAFPCYKFLKLEFGVKKMLQNGFGAGNDFKLVLPSQKLPK